MNIIPHPRLKIPKNTICSGCKKLKNQHIGVIPKQSLGTSSRWIVMLFYAIRVRKYRRQKGWSQEQLGEIVGFSQSKISKIENGDWDSLGDLRLIAKALEVPIEELVRDEHSDEKQVLFVDDQRRM